MVRVKTPQIFSDSQRPIRLGHDGLDLLLSTCGQRGRLMVVQDVQCLRVGYLQHRLARRGPYGHVLTPGEGPGLALGQVVTADADALNQVGLEVLFVHQDRPDHDLDLVGQVVVEHHLVQR